MKNIRQLLFNLRASIFGVKATGEKLIITKLPEERAFNADDYYQWCKEFSVGMMASKLRNGYQYAVQQS